MRARILCLAAASLLLPGLLGSPPATATHDPAASHASATASHRTTAASKLNKPWVQVAPVNFGISQPDLIRVGNHLQVQWMAYDDTTRSVRTRQLTAAGRIDSPTRVVVQNWLALIDDPKLVSVGGDLLSVFAGIRSSAPGDPYVGPAVHASSPNGLDWTLEPGSLSQTTAAGNAESIDVINAQGQPLFAMGGFDQHVKMHRGVSDSSPASEADFFTSNSGCCPDTSVALANDTSTDETWAAWFALGATDPAEMGVFAQKVWPRPNGPMLHAPGTAAGGGAPNPGLPVALASRAGGGVWAAYSLGSAGRTIRLWHVGTSKTLDLKVGQHTTIAMAAGPGGRLWVAWKQLGTDQIRATRTNPQVTKSGAVRRILIPGGSGGQLNRMALEGSGGPLVIAAASQPPGSGSNALYAGQVLPGLTLKVAPKRLAQGQVVVTVSDAGAPVRGAKVSLLGNSAKTNAQGVAHLAVVGSGVPDGRYPVAASKRGYYKAGASIRVT